MKYYAVIDFECTCNGDWDFPNEIIEFPAVLIHPLTLVAEFEFRRFVKPTENPVLLPYCTDLTGIKQGDVDEANELGEVLEEFSTFLEDNELEIMLVTDGPWDVDKFLVPECRRKGLAIPRWAKQWLDIRKKFAKCLELESWLNLSGMLGVLGLEFEGREHSGIDDSRNIAKILVELINRGFKTSKHNRSLKALQNDVFTI